MLTKRYMEAVIEEYFKNKPNENHINVSNFIRETGLTRQEVTTFFRQNDYQEATIGVFKRKL